MLFEQHDTIQLYVFRGADACCSGMYDGQQQSIAKCMPCVAWKGAQLGGCAVKVSFAGSIGIFQVLCLSSTMQKLRKGPPDLKMRDVAQFLFGKKG